MINTDTDQDVLRLVQAAERRSIQRHNEKRRRIQLQTKIIAAPFMIFVAVAAYALTFLPGRGLTNNSALGFGALWAVTQFIGLWVMVDTPWWRWPSRRWEIGATVYCSLLILLFSAGMVLALVGG